MSWWGLYEGSSGEGDSTVAITLTAESFPAIEAGIGKVIGMPLRAMSFASIDCCKAFTPQKILPTGDHLQMSWIHARAIPAKMVQLFVFWYRADCELISETVSRCHPTVKIESTVAFSATTSPKPTSQGALFVNLRPEALVCGKMDSHRKFTPFGATQREASASPLLLLYQIDDYRLG